MPPIPPAGSRRRPSIRQSRLSEGAIDRERRVDRPLQSRRTQGTAARRISCIASRFTPAPCRRGHPLTPTFKWSRENGSVVFPIPAPPARRLRAGGLGRDERFGLGRATGWRSRMTSRSCRTAPSGWCRCSPSIAPGITVRLAGSQLERRKDGRRHPLRAGGTRGPVIRPKAASTRPGQRGTDCRRPRLARSRERRPDPVPPGRRRTGALLRTSDYWTVSARVATGDGSGPPSRRARPGGPAPSPLALPPDGVTHHYAPLAEITIDGTKLKVTTGRTRSFPPLLP